MKNKYLGQLVRTALVATAVMGAQWASAEVVAGSIIKLTDGTGNGRGGAFNGYVVSGASGTWNNSFQSFCLEYNETLRFNTPYYVQGVTDHTVTKSGNTFTQDPISSQTAWLFTQFSENTLSNSALWGHGTQATKNTALQQAIWSFENEAFGSLSSLASSYKILANNAVANGWSGIGNVRVLNLFGYDTRTRSYSTYAQDQLYMVSAVPEPETFAMMLVGLGLMGAIARRRTNNKTA